MKLLPLVLLAACAKIAGPKPALPPLLTYEAKCRGEVTRFQAHYLSDNDDAGESHRAYEVYGYHLTEATWYSDTRVVARFDASCSVAKVTP